ncbi:MAG: serine/threonine-protein kinase [Polyangiaceae bacterium]
MAAAVDIEEVYPPGKVLAGKYRVDRTLGVGGFGIVVAATHLQLEEKVAIKILLPEAARNPEAAQRFIREAKASVRIRSEHVARVTDVGTFPAEQGLQASPYMVMEYLDGCDLSTLVKNRGPQMVPDVCEWIIQGCEAIAEAHGLGIIHRDLKPANLFLTHKVDGAPCIKVLDFGISKIAANEADKGMTKSSDVMGSPYYMSPEQMRSTRAVDPRSDIWALGAILYEMLAGVPPFDGETMTALIVSIMQEAPRDLLSKRRDIPRPLFEIVYRCLEKDPNRRFQDVSELAGALGPFAPARVQGVLSRISAALGGRSIPSRPKATIPGEPATISSPDYGQRSSNPNDYPPMTVPGGYPDPGVSQAPYGASQNAYYAPPTIAQPAVHAATGMPAPMATQNIPQASWGGTYATSRAKSSRAPLIVGVAALAVAAGAGAMFFVLQEARSAGRNEGAAGREDGLHRPVVDAHRAGDHHHHRVRGERCPRPAREHRRRGAATGPNGRPRNQADRDRDRHLHPDPCAHDGADAAPDADADADPDPDPQTHSEARSVRITEVGPRRGGPGARNPAKLMFGAVFYGRNRVMRFRPVAASAALALTLWAAPALAQDEPPDPNGARADALFEEGRNMMSAGQYASACPKFEESQKLRPGIGTLFNLADCHEKVGKTILAYQEFKEVVDRTKVALQPERQKIAEERVAALEAKLGKLVIQIPPTQLRVTVELDGTQLLPDRIGVPLLMPAGDHTVRATTPQDAGDPFETSFTMPGGGATTTVTIPVAAGPKMERNTGLAVVGGILTGLGGLCLLGAVVVVSQSDGDPGGGVAALGLAGLVGLGVGIPLLVVGMKKHPVVAPTTALVIDPSPVPDVALNVAAPFADGKPHPQAGLTATWHF